MAETIKGFDELGKVYGIEKPVTANQQSSRPFQGEKDHRYNQQNSKLHQEANSDPDYVSRAEKVMLTIGKPDKRDSSKRRFSLTTSKIRGILTLFNQIYNDVAKTTDEKLNENIQDHIKYLKVRMVYEAGRDSAVDEFLKASNILAEVDRIGDSRKKFIELERYMEALVAYHRFLGGRDN